MGYGFPAWRGGVLHWAANHPKGGFRYVRDRLAQMAAQWSKQGQNNETHVAMAIPLVMARPDARHGRFGPFRK